MYTSLIVIGFMSVMAPCSKLGVGVFVNEVIRVTGPDSFECRLSDYKPAPAVRFRVHISGVDVQADHVSSRELLEERLKSAEHVELRNVIFKGYFRVEAELWLDGSRFELPPSLDAIKDAKEPQKSIIYSPISALPSTSVRSPEPATKVVSANLMNSFTIEALLERNVDCSMLTDDTTLAEALEFLCESVQPRLPLLIRWDDLQANAFVDKDTPIGVEGFGRLKLCYALNHILQAAAGREPKPALIAEGGILILGSHEMLQKHKSTRVYVVRDLLAVPSRGNLSQQGGRGNLGNAVNHFSR